jgi:hypothetical protein
LPAKTLLSSARVSNYCLDGWQQNNAWKGVLAAVAAAVVVVVASFTLSP